MATTTTMGNPIKITGTCAAAEVITANYLRVQKVVWYGATSAAQKVHITDTDGNTLFKFTADAPGTSGEMMYTYEFPVHPHPCFGLKVSDMDAGEVYIYYVGAINKPSTIS